MSINPAELGQASGNVLIDVVQDVHKQLVEMKTKPQIVGAESIKVGGIPAGNLVYSNGPFTIAAGNGLTVNFNFSPTSSTLTIWNFLYSVYVDVRDGAHVFPNGSSLTSTSRNLRVAGWDSAINWNSTTQHRTYIVRLENYDTVSHDYYVDVKAFIPLLSGSTVA